VVRRRALGATAYGALAISLAAFAGVIALAVVPPSVAAGARSAPAWTRPPAPSPSHHQVLVIGHRGAASYRPEHTLDGYALAIQQGADYIEPDLVPTKDGVLVARHENRLSLTTDVAAHPEFATMRTTKRINGQKVTDWFTEDFTLAQLKTLRARERDPKLRPESAAFDGLDDIPTLEEIIKLARDAGAQRHRPVGLYLEAKLPAYFSALGLDPVPLLLATLHRTGLDRAGSPVFVESFEAASLRELHTLAPGVAEVQLYWPSGPAPDAAGLAAAREYAIGIGVDRSMLSGTLVESAHTTGLCVHAYTYGSTDTLADYQAVFALGVDGVFTDNPDRAITARDSTPG